jgi:hypothetical protein
METETGLVKFGEQVMESVIMPVKTRVEIFLQNGVKCNDDYGLAVELVKEIKAARLKIGDILDPFVKASYKSWKEVCKERAKYDVPLENAEAALKPILVKYIEDCRIKEQANTEQRPAGTITPDNTPKIDGISFRDNYTAYVKDEMALIKAVAEGKVTIMAIQINQSFLNQQARSLKDTLDYPGVVVVKEKIMSARAE